MPAMTNAELLKAVADAMQISVAEMSPRWGNLAVSPNVGIIPDANDEALRDIYGILGARGWSQAAIDGWERLKPLHRLQGLYWAFVHGAGLHNFDDRWVNKYDQRTNLEKLAVTDAGGIVDGTGSPGVAASALLDTTNDRYTMDTPL